MKSLPRVEARIPEAMKSAMAVQSILVGGTAMISPERRTTWTSAPTMAPVMGFESLMPMRARTALAP